MIDDNGDGIGHYLNEPGYDPSTPGEDGYLANSTYLGVVNYPPSEPSKPDCDTWGGYQGIEYTFESDTTDPEEDEIYYLFDWGDDTDSIWLGPYTSGATVEASHIWTENGTYYVRVKAKDMVFNEHESLWSEPFKMKIGEDEDQPASSSEYTQNEMAESEYNLPLH